ncbi:MAG: hypothetical protein KDD37_03350, partial [Bdellovibrionales bacterium]|nr:hypothetical protein [Bdellovibrionales bacterium]
MMDWQSLPLLKSSFFANLEVNTISHLLKIGDYWSSDMMPVGLWENTAIIAVTNPDCKVPDMGIPSIVVRAEKKDLEKIHALAFPQNDLSAPVIPPTVNIDDIKIPPIPQDMLEEGDAPSDPIPAPPTEDLSPTYQAPPVPEVNLDFSQLNVEQKSEVSPPPPPPPPNDVDTDEVTKRFSVPSEP